MRQAPVVSIELLLDGPTESAVRTEWEALAAAGLSSLAAHRSATNRPHITLLVGVDLPALDPRAFAGRTAFEVRLGAPLLFGTGDRRVLARSVVPSHDLLSLHRDVHAAIGSAAAEADDGAHTAPGAWTPHVTLARRVRTKDLERALGLVGGEIRGTARAIRRWDAATRTVTEIGELGGSQT
ncbi:2'-5' RNA ligase family protein [Microbacterium sp. NPDC089987]|uniref:2'-5' RNA ligase family protein n=1 Tax=Microbacterium sp. NPDC089987 TaxID=3364202 RepID=UPI00381EDA9C